MLARVKLVSWQLCTHWQNHTRISVDQLATAEAGRAIPVMERGNEVQNLFNTTALPASRLDNRSSKHYYKNTQFIQYTKFLHHSKLTIDSTIEVQAW